MEHVERLIVDLKESLERQLHAFGEEMGEGFARIESKFDTEAARLDRQAGLLQAHFDQLEKRNGNSGTGSQPAE